jgi:hypothetical protein
MDTSHTMPLADAIELMGRDWNDFTPWYTALAERHPAAFPLAQAPIRWLMAMRGWKYLRDVPPGLPTQTGVPQDAQSWYELNITERPFLVIVGEVVTILFLAELHYEAYEFIRRVRDLIAWLGENDDYDEGQLFHIVQEYVRPTTAMRELS